MSYASRFLSFLIFFSCLSMAFQLRQFCMSSLAFLKCLNRSFSTLWTCIQWYLSMTSPFFSATTVSSNSVHPQTCSHLSPSQALSSFSSSVSHMWVCWWDSKFFLNLSRIIFSWDISLSPVYAEPESKTLSYVENHVSSSELHLRVDSPKFTLEQLSFFLLILMIGFFQKSDNIDIKSYFLAGAGALASKT